MRLWLLIPVLLLHAIAAPWFTPAPPDPVRSACCGCCCCGAEASACSCVPRPATRPAEGRTDIAQPAARPRQAAARTLRELPLADAAAVGRCPPAKGVRRVAGRSLGSPRAPPRSALCVWCI